ncbi:MAG: tRNA lysidine(34) synthetase TilS [Anaerotruncus sp.]|nr:MAG: tRNA lysidine(34) synthetase TilS [Anaerotruncus sp.]
MNDKITQTVEKNFICSLTATRFLIALSGGADSVFLAEYLLSVKKKYNLKLIAAHVEHGIRGSESLADCEFCEKYCKEKKIPIFVKHIDAPAEAKKAALGVEEFSRQARYNFFYSIECDKIATAHSLSDNAETLIFFALQGALRLKAPAQFRRLAAKSSARL